MFRNLEAEQARLGLSNESMAEYLGISRVAYENKKKTGKFKYIEIKNFSCYVTRNLNICLQKQKRRPESG